MNPFEDFYEKKDTYEKIKGIVGEFSNIYDIDVKGNLNDGWQIVIELRDNLVEDMGNDEKWEIYKYIEASILTHRDKISEHLVKKLEERMEIARGIVLKDFKLIGSKKEVK